MIKDVLFLIKLIVSFLPFVLFAFLNGKVNAKKELRYKQFLMPVLALVYSIVLMIFLSKINALCLELFLMLAGLFDKIKLAFIGKFIRNIYNTWGIYLELVLFNTLALIAYVFVKRFLTLIFNKITIRKDTFVGKVVGLFYYYNEEDDQWFIKDHFGQARTFIKAAYYGSCVVSGLAMLISCVLCMKHLVSAPFYPAFAVILIGEMAFVIDGIREDEQEKAGLSMQADRSKHVTTYPLLRKPLKELFGDKLSADGTTVNNGTSSGGAAEDILASLEQTGGHIGKNYAAFIRAKVRGGLKPNVDYVRSGYDLAQGKSLLFNTPFYDKLNPYVFYAMNRELLTGGKVLIVLGRHGTEDDLYQWCEQGMQSVSNIPGLWSISVLSREKKDEDALSDIGIISRSGVHDLDIHKANLPFLKKVSFVVVVEPSRLVTTAQIGLNLLIRNCGQDRSITFCSVDRNCDGLVDALSHILMTNITEVSATEYPHGMSSYMYWTADSDYLQHRLLPGVSRYLGMGTELSFVALKNQVKKTVWYGGETFPVLDARWIAKQYYYDLLDYAQLPTNQESFDVYFQTSFNMCNEKVRDHSFITVEDDRNNLFETRRNFATIAEEQGFVNVISSEYMLREYMSANTGLFTADAKAIPYVTADYARSKRNAILSLCLLLCIDPVNEETLNRQMIMMNIDTTDPATEIWKEVCVIFSNGQSSYDKNGTPILTVNTKYGQTVSFEKDETIVYKRAYSVESGRFESVYAIENASFAQIILDDLQNASYIAEQESKDVYIGTELKGHVYQKYLPGQFFTLNGKYYEMISTAKDNRILVRRASEHIGGRLSYRQVRNYTISNIEDSAAMGALKTVNNIDIHYQFADIRVETPGYWKLDAFNNFDGGALVTVNGVPKREYHHKQIVKFDFSKLGESFTDSVRFTMTNLLNETFVTLFAENQPFICAITPGNFEAPITYNLTLEGGDESSDKCIYIVEDSQLDIGLLIAVERNVNRIFQIISDYLSWNDEMIEESLRKQNEVPEEKPEEEAVQEEPAPKQGFFKKIGNWFKNLFKGKKKKGEAEEVSPKPKKPGLFGRLFGRKNKTELQDVPAQDYMMIYGKPHKLVKGKWVACSQEEFDAKMNERHRIIDENEAAEKARKEAEAAAAKEAADERSEEPSEEDTDVSPVADAQTREEAEEDSTEEPSDEASEETSDEADVQEESTEEVVEETPAKLSWFGRMRAARAEKKVEKAQKKQAKKEAKEARKAEKANAKQAARDAAAEVAEETVPAEEQSAEVVPETTAEDVSVEAVEETQEEAVEETAEDPAQAQSEGEVSEDE